MNKHLCEVVFETRRIDECCGIGKNTCEGTNPMLLNVWYADKDGTECYYDNVVTLKVAYCPFCGIRAEGESDEA